MTVVVRLLALIIACLSGWVVIPPSAAAAPTALSGSSGYLFSSAWASMPAHGCSESMVHIRKAWCEVSPATCTSYDRRIANGEADIAHPLGGTDATTHAEAVKGVAGRSMMVKAWGSTTTTTLRGLCVRTTVRFVPTAPRRNSVWVHRDPCCPISAPSLPQTPQMAWVRRSTTRTPSG